MSTPGTSHRRQIGRTTDHNAIGVYVSREVTLDEDLSRIVWRRLKGIDVVVRDKYEDARAVTLDRAQTERLRDALSDALSATLRDTENLGAAS